MTPRRTCTASAGPPAWASKGKAFTFVSRDQGELLTKVENLINMIIPQATLEDFEPSPQPGDWTDAKPGFGGPTPGPSTQTPTSEQTSITEHPQVPLPPPRSLGRRIPITPPPPPAAVRLSPYHGHPAREETGTHHEPPGHTPDRLLLRRFHLRRGTRQG